MDSSYSTRQHRLRVYLVLRCCAILILFWTCRRAITNHTGSSYSKSIYNYDLTQAELGRAFFHRLIHRNDSYKEINQSNVCSLMHFFFQEATQNGKSIQFSTGMFVLYDSTHRFFDQLMTAKSKQPHYDEHRSGFIRRLVYFAFDTVKWIFQILFRRNSSWQSPFIYLRGDESSHFRERGNLFDRWHLYPAYGMDIVHGCMSNEFAHILFGQLQSLPLDSVSPDYFGERIYIKPERSGLQQFRDYLAHATHYIRAVSNAAICRCFDQMMPRYCTSEGVFHEWVDRRLVDRWSQILATIETLTLSERTKMRDQVLSDGIREIYRQTHLFSSTPHVHDFRRELEQRYGSDVSARKGQEIIFTTEQLLSNSLTCLPSIDYEKQQCDVTHVNN